MPPRGIEQILYDALMRSHTFHRFVQGIYYKVNGIDPRKFQPLQSSTKITQWHKFKAWRMLFVDELRHSVGLRRRL